MAKPAYYWAKMAIFGQNILFFLGGSTFGINISETPKAPGWHWFLGLVAGLTIVTVYILHLG